MRESILLLALYIGAAVIFLLGVVLHEAGHLAGGLLSGYRFVSFRIFSWVLFKEDQKLRFRRSRQGFVVGQCLMAPPEEGEAFRFMLYNLGGGLFNAIATVLCLLLGACFFGSEYSVFAFIGFAINGVLAMGNLIPSGV
ncbi:MAG: hypothetical protein LBS96_02080, partial [Oscillospiraceae bacterium]|nr:hypothetical protein [Oscillospiraceae bacterium]